jgi:hypothetical protein
VEYLGYLGVANCAQQVAGGEPQEGVGELAAGEGSGVGSEGGVAGWRGTCFVS